MNPRPSTRVLPPPSTLMFLLLLSPTLATTFTISASITYDWTPVHAVLLSSIQAGYFPGAAAAVRDSTGQVVFSAEHGNLTFNASLLPPPQNNGANPAVSYGETLFDMASCSKILGPVTTAAYLYEQSLLDLDMTLADPSLLGPGYNNNGKDSITIRNLLLHNAGFPPDPSPGYWEELFGCPATLANLSGTPLLTFSCSELIFTSVLNQTLMNPVGSKYVYSDLSMITLLYTLGIYIYAQGWVGNNNSTNNNTKKKNEGIERPTSISSSSPSFIQLQPGCVLDSVEFPGLTAMCAYEAYWRTYIHPRLGLSNATGYLPPSSTYPLAMPTWNDSYYRHEIMQGVVSDENAYASGGLQGHAGIFAVAEDISAFTAVWGYQYRPPPPQNDDEAKEKVLGREKERREEDEDEKEGTVSSSSSSSFSTGTPFPDPQKPLLNKTTVAYWSQVQNASFSPRALGWITQSPLDTYQGCGNLSSSTYYHTGYTGTLMCIDPVRNWTTILLTNRVFPNSTGNTVGILQARQAFNNAVIEVMERPARG